MNNTKNIELLKKLESDETLPKEAFIELLSTYTDEDSVYARRRAREISAEYFANGIYIRGLIEFTNICRQNCLYCGLRRGNKCAERYRLSEEEILSCCQSGYTLGFRTFVLQGGEDAYYTDDIICGLVSKIKSRYPDCAVTLSIGEKSRESYRRFFEAGADRYLLRHETADPVHYSGLHPEEQSLESRLRCLHDLKEIGFQTGCGFMVGSPYQTSSSLADDLCFIAEFRPHMVGIGPFIPHRDTPFRDKPCGDLRLTLFLLALVRIMLKRVLLPATTALGTLSPKGREMGILSGANVVMPNLSPSDVRAKYALYNNKLHTGDEAAESLTLLKKHMGAIGYELLCDRGDYPESDLHNR